MLRLVANRTTRPSRSVCKRSSVGAAFGQSIGRSTNSSSNYISSSTQRRDKHTTVGLQLDYYMSPQFAGIACALTEGLYETAGIDNVKFLSTCPVGLEPERVRQFRDISNDTDVVLGSIEQNVLLPTLLKNPDFKVKAVAAIFQQSPLCLLSLGDNDNSKEGDGETKQVVGAHEDTVDLLKRILIYDNYQQGPKHLVVASPRATKIQDLVEGKLDAIQAYTTTEVLTLQRIVEEATGGKHKPEDLSTILLEGHNGAKLGYSQVLFAPEEDLAGDQREILRAFLGATFEGWTMAANDPEHGARCVEEAQAMLKLSDEGNDHWDRRDLFEYNLQSTKACCDLVRLVDTSSSSSKNENNDQKLGIIDPDRWDESTQWLLNENVPPNFGLDSSVWEAGKSR